MMSTWPNCRRLDEAAGLAERKVRMRRLVSIAALILSFGLGFASLAMAQSEIYVPALAEIMSTAQWRHIKLWFAGKHANWELASYELRQVRASLEDAATHYHGIQSNM